MLLFTLFPHTWRSMVKYEKIKKHEGVKAFLRNNLKTLKHFIFHENASRTPPKVFILSTRLQRVRQGVSKYRECCYFSEMETFYIKSLIFTKITFSTPS